MTLLAITDRRCMGDDPVQRIRALMARLGDQVIVQIRERDLPARTLQRWIEEILPVAEKTKSRLMVSERLDLALCYAPSVGVHLPEDGLSVSEARALAPKEMLVGASVHAVESGLARLAEGAELVTLSPIFETPSKPGSRPLGIAPLEELVRRAPQGRVFALGGIEASNEQVVRAVGAHVAAIRWAWRA
jgi:thiamine-phosphate pyrophosphorylase